jgi:FtsZ-binding cell division protein ZapB
MTENKRYDVIYEKEPRGQVVTDNGIPCTARTCCTRLNILEEENEQLKNSNHTLAQTLIKNMDSIIKLEKENEQLKKENECFKDKLCELGVSDVKGIDTGLEDWLND